MDPQRFLMFLRDAIPAFELIDGRVFLRRPCFTRQDVEANVREFKSAAEAQSWVNLVLFDDYLNELSAGSFDPTSLFAKEVLTLLQLAWESRIRIEFPTLQFEVKKVVDAESGDFGLALIQFGEI